MGPRKCIYLDITKGTERAVSRVFTHVTCTPKLITLKKSKDLPVNDYLLNFGDHTSMQLLTTTNQISSLLSRNHITI